MSLFTKNWLRMRKKSVSISLAILPMLICLFDGYETPSIFQVEGAMRMWSLECYTLSKSYNMAGWRVGFVVGNKSLLARCKIKSWFDYGMLAPIQVKSTVALDGPQECR